MKEQRRHVPGWVGAIPPAFLVILGTISHYREKKEVLIERADKYFCKSKDRERFIKALDEPHLKRFEGNENPIERLKARYTRTLAKKKYYSELSKIRDEYFETTIAIQEKIKEWLNSVRPSDYKFDPKQNRFFWVDGKQMRLGRFLSRAKAPSEIMKLLTQFPGKITPAPKKGKKIIFEISTNPVDILTKATGRKWAGESCERLEASYDDGSFSDIKNENGIVFLYWPDEVEPFGRFMLRWCISDSGKIDIGVEPQIYPKTGVIGKMGSLIKKELIEFLKEKGYLNYSTCTTPYIYEGYSDQMQKGRTKITYHLKKLGIKTSEIREMYEEIKNIWTGLEWDETMYVDQTNWLTPYEVLEQINMPKNFYRASYEEAVYDRYGNYNIDHAYYSSDPLRTIAELFESLDEELPDPDLPDNLLGLLLEYDPDEFGSLLFYETLMKDYSLEEKYAKSLSEKIKETYDSLQEKRESIGITTGDNIEISITTDIESGKEWERAQEYGISLQAVVDIRDRLTEIENDADSARDYGKKAVEAAEAGDWDRAIELAAEASSIENEYGDDPTWGPFHNAIMRAAESAGG